MGLFSYLLRFYFIADNDIHIPGYAGDSSTTHKTVHRQKTLELFYIRFCAALQGGDAYKK